MAGQQLVAHVAQRRSFAEPIEAECIEVPVVQWLKR